MAMFEVEKLDSYEGKSSTKVGFFSDRDVAIEKAKNCGVDMGGNPRGRVYRIEDGDKYGTQIWPE